ncbi:DUF2993 domain-containing protein [Corynebacterium yudongzhengii]|uniref:DUF2993 domain-containing protein n=1 Tax=Corynebacterium yudongzhengii TaxID=2080740 RepID=A0A2U1T5Q3_9CORY|nr:DUF2993 domain-containing protein [Corynebacterium yudongzhengii]AWB82585.1 DUF2993 domain-containing protein [Corynebacterium yudongzhengii]PWC01319.1 DUF2993 domain-containing protein [Corynebacterium yudongzhengii]
MSSRAVTTANRLRPWQRRLLGGVVGVAVAAGAVWVVDSAIAMRVEAKLSGAVEESANLSVSPDTYVGGTPYLGAALFGEIPMMSVQSLDLSVEGLGIVNARTELSGIEVTPGQVLSGNFEGAPTELLKREISLDGVAFGQLLGITDLDIANPYDISPGGGVASEAQLTGTPPGFDDPVTVLVDLRLRGPMFVMTVKDILDAPEGRIDEVTETFTYTMDTRQLPLQRPASQVQMSGGSIIFESERQAFELELGLLAPLDTGAADDPETAAWKNADDIATDGGR